MAQKIIPCGGWYVDENTLSFDENKVLSVVGGGGEAGVDSFNGRAGAVTPAQGDYTAALVGAVDKAGDTMTGDLDMSGNDVTGVHSVIAEGSTNSGLLFESNGTIVGVVTGGTRSATFTANSIDAYEHRISRVGEPLNDTDAARKQEVDAVQTAVDTVSETVDGIIDGTELIPYLPDNGGTLTGTLNMGNNKITMGATPTETTDVTNKGYVDGVVKVVSDEVDGIIAGTTPISVPIATDAKVGGVKIGAGLSVDGEGTLTTAQTYLSTQGGTLEANASITGEDEMTFEVPDSTESATVGITPESVTLTHNTNSASDGSVRVASNAVEIKAGATTVQINGTGVNFGGGALSNINSIGSSASAIAFENDMDMNNHKITNLIAPTQSYDAVNLAYLQGYGSAATATIHGTVLKGTAVTDATGETDIVTQFNALLASLRTAGIISQ